MASTVSGCAGFSSQRISLAAWPPQLLWEELPDLNRLLCNPKLVSELFPPPSSANDVPKAACGNPHQPTISGGVIGWGTVQSLEVGISEELGKSEGTVNDESRKCEIGLSSNPLFLIRYVTQQPMTQVLNDLDSHLHRSEYFRFFWFPHTDKTAVFYGDRTDKPVKTTSNWLKDYIIGYYLLELLLWISTFFPRLVPWIIRFFYWLVYSAKVTQVKRSDKAFNFECLFKQHVSDWAVPIEKTGAVLGQLKEWLDRNPEVRVHFPVEIRFARADEIFLSPCYKRDSCFINIIMYRPYGKEVPRKRYWAIYEEIMRKNGGRPHWAKANSCAHKDFEQMYPAFQNFCSIREKLDPLGMFLNNFLEKTFF